MAVVERLRCPVCGVARHVRHFGVVLGEQGYEYNPEVHPQHDLEAVTTTLLGNKNLANEKHALTLEQATALRESLRNALARLEEAIGASDVSEDEDPE